MKLNFFFRKFSVDFHDKFGTVLQGSVEVHMSQVGAETFNDINVVIVI